MEKVFCIASHQFTTKPLAVISPALKEAIKNGECVPFVGAGLSRAAAQLPLWGTLMERMIARLRAEAPHVAESASKQLAAGRILDCAEIVRDNLPDFPGALREDLSPTEEPKVAFLDAVLEIASSVIVTTNYDSLFKARGVSDIVDNENTYMLAQLQRGRQRSKPWLWHLHGLLERPSTLVFGRKDYDRLYFERTDHGERVLGTFRALLYQKQVLFIGYGFGDDPVMREFLRWQELFNGTTIINAFAIVRKERDEAESKRYAELERDFSLRLIKVDDWDQDFLKTLQDLAAARGTSSGRLSALPAPQPGLIPRPQLLQKVKSALSQGPDGPLALVGPGGSGKTQLALHLARQGLTGQFTFFLRCSTEASLDESLRQLARVLLGEISKKWLETEALPSGNASLLASIGDAFAAVPSGYRLIMDDFDTNRKDVLFNLFPAPCPSGTILITSRDKGWIEFCRVETLTDFNDEEFESLRTRFNVPADRMAEIRDKYSGHPLSTFHACLRTARGLAPELARSDSSPVAELVRSILEDLQTPSARRALFVLAMVHPTPACASLLRNCIGSSADQDDSNTVLWEAKTELYRYCLVAESQDGGLVLNSWLAEGLLQHAPKEEFRSTLLLLPDRLLRIHDLSGSELISYALSVASFVKRYPFDMISKEVEIFRGDVNKLLWTQVYIPFLEKASTTLSDLRMVKDELEVRTSLAMAYQYLFANGISTVGSRELTERLIGAAKRAQRLDRSAIEELNRASEILEQMYGVNKWTEIRDLPASTLAQDPPAPQTITAQESVELFLQFRSIVYAELCGGASDVVQAHEAQLAFAEYWAFFTNRATIRPNPDRDGSLFIELVDSLLNGGLGEEARQVLDHEIMRTWAASPERYGFRVKHRRARMLGAFGNYTEFVRMEMDALEDICARPENLVSDLIGVFGTLQLARAHISIEGWDEINRTVNQYLLRQGVLRPDVDQAIRDRLG